MKKRKYAKHVDIKYQGLLRFFRRINLGLRPTWVNKNKRRNKGILLLLKKKLFIKYQKYNNRWIKKDKYIRTLWLNFDKSLKEIRNNKDSEKLR